MILSDSEKLSLAMEMMSEKDVEKYAAVVNIAEVKDISIYDALTEYHEYGA